MRPSNATVETVMERDRMRCARCGGDIDGIRGEHWSAHHRQPAGMGGTKRPDAHGPTNLVLLHGSGTTRCHGWVERNRAAAYEAGWLVRHPLSPVDVPVRHAVHGLVYLLPDGGVSPIGEAS